MNIRFDAGIAKSADKDRIEVVGEHGEAIRRNGRSIAEITVCAPVEIGCLHRRARGSDRVNCLRNHFFTDAVAGDNGDAFLLADLRAHGWNVNTLAIIEYRYGI